MNAKTFFLQILAIHKALVHLQTMENGSKNLPVILL